MLEPFVRTPSALQTRTRPVLPVTAEGLFVRRQDRVLIDIGALRIDGAGITVLIGPNGAGKSLLLAVLAGLFPPDRGRVSWNGAPLDRYRYCRFAMLLQRPVLLRRSVRANIEFALRAAGWTGREVSSRAGAALETARMTPLARAPARILSGGEMQRLALARALSIEPDLMFLDEPTSSLDPASMQTIEAMIGEAAARGTRVVLIAHDLAQARRLGDEIILMHRGRIVERAGAEAFLAAPASEEARAFVEGRIVV